MQNRPFNSEKREIGHTPSEIREALSLKRMGGQCFLNFCAGGETLLNDELIPIIQELLEEGHFVQIVTNGSLQKPFQQIVALDSNLLKRLFLKISFHYLELKKRNLLDVFFLNVKTVRDARIAFSLEITPSDELIPEIESVKELSLREVGALPHITIARTENNREFEILSKYSKEEYRQIWSVFESPLFDLKMKLIHDKRGEFCYGGEWTAYLDLKSGELRQCYIGEVVDNIYAAKDQPLHFRPIGRQCPERYCYNGHAWMTWGCIPGMNLPTYGDMRNRVCKDGTEWLTPAVKEFFSHRLEESHIQYTEKAKEYKVLLFGDSICMGNEGFGYSKYVKEQLQEIADLEIPADLTRFSAYFLRHLQDWVKELHAGTDVDIVHFNVGLWDVLRINGQSPLTSLKEYENNLKKIAWQLKYYFPQAKLIFATTTPVNSNNQDYSLLRNNADIEEYNDVAVSVMKENNVVIDDLYSVAQQLKDEYVDSVHFNKKGALCLAQSVKEVIHTTMLS